MNSPVIEHVVENDLCIGCGLCAALCPQSILEVKWNRYGEYNPVETTVCPSECGLCLKVCPFYDPNPNEDSIGRELYGNTPAIKHLSETGYYLDSYVGYSKAKGHRQYGASGGMATWLLERLLTEGVVDHVVCVAPTDNHESLFSFMIFDTAEGVRAGAGSAYYPVEMSEIIRQVIEMPGRYAVTGLPCFVKAIRLAQQKNTKLRERVVVTVGLVCGQLKTSHFTDYIAALAGVRGEVTAVRYRGKSQDQPASNYHYAFTTEGGEVPKIFWNEGIAEAWVSRWFTPNVCNYCDDIFAECADVTFMDAWLPEYSKDYRGTNLIVVRSPLIKDLIASGIQEGDILADPVPIQDVIRSQAGVVDIKRRHLAYRLYLDRQKGQKVLRKRISPARPKSPFLRREVALKDNMRISSRVFWENFEKPDADSLRKEMNPDLKQLANARQIAKIITLPIRTVRCIRGKVWGNHHE